MIEELNLREASYELIKDASQAGNLLFRTHDQDGSFVRAKHSYDSTPEIRETYLRALEYLLEQHKVKQVLKNGGLELFEVEPEGLQAIQSESDALEQLQAELTRCGIAFKFHCRDGDFVQCGPFIHNSTDEERIFFLKALADMLAHGQVLIVSESRDCARYELVQRSDL